MANSFLLHMELDFDKVRLELANPTATDVDALDYLRDIEDTPSILVKSNIKFISSLPLLTYKQLLSAFTTITTATQHLLKSRDDSREVSREDCGYGCVVMYNYAVTRVLCEKYKEQHSKKRKSPFTIDAYLVIMESIVDVIENAESVLMSVVDLFQFDLIQFPLPHMTIASILIKCLHKNQTSNYSNCVASILNTSDTNITQFALCLNELHQLDDDIVYNTTMEAVIDAPNKALPVLIAQLHNESFLKHLPLCQSFLSHENPHVRIATLSSLTQLIINNQSFDNPHDMQHVLELIIERLYDAYATCRSKTISCIVQLISAKLFPLDQYLDMTQLILQRCKDKSHFVRKSAFKFIPTLVKYHPFDKQGGLLKMSIVTIKITEIQDFMTLVEQKQHTPTDSQLMIELCSEFHVNPSSIDDDTIVPLLSTILEYYNNYKLFIELFLDNKDYFIHHLSSDNKSEVVIVIDVIYSLYQYELSPHLLKSILHLIWSKDESVSAAVYKTFQQLFTSPQHLIEFYYTCNDVDFLSLLHVLKQLTIDWLVDLIPLMSNSPKKQAIACAKLLSHLQMEVDDDVSCDLYLKFKHPAFISLIQNQSFLLQELPNMSMSCARAALLQLDPSEAIFKSASQNKSILSPLFISACMTTKTTLYLQSVFNKFHSHYANQQTLQVGQSKEDIFIQFIEQVQQMELFHNNEVFKGYANFVSWMARHYYLHDALIPFIVYSLGKFMCCNEQFCQQHIELFLHLNSIKPSVNGVVLLGELLITNSNVVTPYTNQLFNQLQNSDSVIVKSTLIVTTTLILQGLVKAVKVMGHLSQLLLHEDLQIREITRGFFIELHSREGSLYNYMMDSICHPSSTVEIIEYLMQFVKPQQVELILEKMLVKLDTKMIDFLFILPIGENDDKYLKKLMIHYQYYKQELIAPEMNTKFIQFIEKLKIVNIENKLALEDFLKEVKGIKQSPRKKKELDDITQPKLVKSLVRMSLTRLQSDDEEMEDAMEQ